MPTQSEERMLSNVISCWRAVVYLAVIAVGIAGCGGGGGSQDAQTAAATATDQTSSLTMTISGTPASSAVVGTAYSFSPSVNAPAGSKVSYSVQNKPAWAAFDSTSGALTGTPDAASVGTYANIAISATNGSDTASLGAFSITVTDVANGTATVNWTIPTANSDGSTLTNLAGFRIYYGTAADSLTKMMQVSNSGTSTYVITNLPPATWYFSVKAYTSSGTESAASNVASKTIS
jgi:hypothetical protein